MSFIEHSSEQYQVNIIQDQAFQTFQEQIKLMIRVSDRNKQLQKKLKIGNQRNSLLRTDQLQLQYTDQHPLANPSQSIKLINSQARLRLQPGTCFLWYIIKGKSLKNIIPDYQLHQCKLVFINTIKKIPTCHQAHFGLAKLLAHQGKYSEAFSHIQQASTLNPIDPLLKVWKATLFFKFHCKSYNEAFQAKKAFDGILADFPDQLQALWGLMDLSMTNLLSQGKQIEYPGFYASRIKQRDSYYGYLAWSVVLFEDPKQKSTAINTWKELTRNFPNHPQAYLKLWNFYFRIKNFQKAEQIATQAFLRVTDVDQNYYYILFCLLYAKTFYKTQKLKNCFELLQHKFVQHPLYSVFLYEYGKYCTKAHSETFISSAISALQGCVIVCEPERLGGIYFWLSKAYRIYHDNVNAYICMKKALIYLDPTQRTKKQELVQTMEEFKHDYQMIIQTQEELKKKLSQQGILKLREKVGRIMQFEQQTGQILLAKTYWVQNSQRKALEILGTAAQKSSLKLEPYIPFIQYLKWARQFQLMQDMACDFLHKSKNIHIPIHIWVKSVLFYSDALFLNNRISKSISLLKCLAKIYFPYSFQNIPYTKVLHRANSLTELQNACLQVMNQSEYQIGNNRYSYSITNLEKLQRKSVEKESINSRFIPDGLISPRGGHQRQKSTFKQKLRHNSRAKRFNSLTIRTEIADQQLQAALVRGNSMDEKDGNSVNLSHVGFSVIGDPKFLFKIGKVCGKTGEYKNDGICALQDYLFVLKYDMNETRKELYEVKARYWQAILGKQTNSESLQLFQQLLEDSQRIGCERYSRRIQQELIQMEI